MRQFELVLSNQKARSYRFLFLLFILLNLAFFLVLAIRTEDRSVVSIAGVCLLMSIGGLATEYLLKKRNKAYSGKGVAATFIIIGYVSLQFWWAALAVFMVAFLYVVSVRHLIVYVNHQEIIYPSFPKKHLSWAELNNVILKDGILTIDLKNNKLAQAEVINGENDYDLDEKEFNEFCRQQLKTAN